MSTDDGAWLEAVEPPPAGDLVVAVSGGPDSAFLAWAMSRLADPRLVHVHHGTPDADRLAGAAESLAAHLGLPLEVVEVSVPDGPSWEHQARVVRGDALRNAAGAAPVATGHHLDDQAETVVANLLRGAGARGLAGMHAARPGWIRPLLAMRRDDIRTAAEQLGLPFVDDPANLDPAHTRNLIRHEVLPALEDAAPGVAVRIATTSELLAADDGELEAAASGLRLTIEGDRVLLSVHELRVVPAPVAARAVRRAIRLIDGVYPGTADDVASVLDVAFGGASRATIGGAIDVERDRAELSLRSSKAGDPMWASVELSIPGRVAAGARWVSARPASGLPAGPRRAIVSTAALSTSSVVVRPVRAGDRIDIRGGSKPVSDALREAAVALRDRSVWPVVDVGGRIVWLAGVRVAAWAVPGRGESATMLETGVI